MDREELRNRTKRFALRVMKEAAELTALFCAIDISSKSRPTNAQS